MDNTPQVDIHHQEDANSLTNREAAKIRSEKVVNTFIDERYDKEQDYYDKISKKAEEICKAALKEEGIRAEYKSRAKDPDRLKAKCIRRIREKNQQYSDPEDIVKDIKDLAGVRIALYFPNQKVNVSKLINQLFESVDEKEHTGKEHEGYIAKHYFVRLKPKENPDGSKEKITKGIIEIQVMSVLLNAWSNVGHDILYKEMYGAVSDQEKFILDGLNRLLSTGDWFLDTFHHTHIDRAKKENAPFANHFELGAYLSKKFSKKIQQKQGGMKLGPVKGMYDLLENVESKASRAPEHQNHKLNLNTPEGLESIIDKISFEDAEFRKLKEGFGEYEMTISVYIMNHVLTRFGGISDKEPPQDNFRWKLEVMLSTIIWLDKLFPTNFAFEDNLVKRGNEREKQLVKWIHEQTEVRELILNPEDADSKERKVKQFIEEAWQFFDRCTTDPVVQFAFKLSETGVRWEFPQNFARLEKRNLLTWIEQSEIEADSTL